jgi:hypothetical protein
MASINPNSTIGTSNARGTVLNMRAHVEAAALLGVHADSIKARAVVSIACDIIHGVGVLARDASNDPATLRSEDFAIIYKGLVRDIASFKPQGLELRRAIIADLLASEKQKDETNEGRGTARTDMDLTRRKTELLAKAVPLAAVLHHLKADKVPEYREAGTLRLDASAWIPNESVRVLLMVKRGKNSRTERTWREGDTPSSVAIPIDGTHTISYDVPSDDGVVARHVRNTVDDLLKNHKAAKGSGKGGLNMLRAIELLARLDAAKPPTVPADKLPAVEKARKVCAAIAEASRLKINARKAKGKAKAKAKAEPVPTTTPPAPPLPDFKKTA